jgi:hypothetical protein
VLKQEVLAVVFQQLMDVTPIPPLFMRSVRLKGGVNADLLY